MNYQFRKAQRTEAKPLIGLFSESGCGKTFSALLLGRGFVGPQGSIGMIETEAGRGEMYVGVDPVGDYLVTSIRSDFSPIEYGKAISAAEAAKLDALIIDSASHEWEGVNGVLAMAAENQAAGKKGPLVWQKPKMDHARHFMLRLMQTPIPLVIVNMRAKYPMQEKRKASGEKEWVRSEDLEPKQSEDILFEMMCHGWIGKDHALHVTKYPKALPAWKDIIVDGKPITIETGQRLAAWAKGSGAPQVAAASPSSSAASAPAGDAGWTTRTDTLMALCSRAGVDYDKVLERAAVPHADEMSEQDYKAAKSALEKRASAKKAA